MGALPSAIIMINGDISYPQSPPYFVGTTPSSELQTLETQLFIDDTMTKQEFDARVIADPNYPTIVHLCGLRILVILDTFQDGYNRDLADVVMFLHQGLADIECNRFGPPGQNYEIQRINIYEILRAAHSHNVATVPYRGCENCKYPFFCDRCHTFSGIKICNSCQCNSKCGCDCGLFNGELIHAPNCDNEFHNHDFIHRK